VRDVCVHYSLKYQCPGRASPDQAAQRLRTFLSDLHQLTSSDDAEGPGTSVLLVSGGGKKRAVNTLSVLQKLQVTHAGQHDIPLLIAFNPYLPEDQDRKQEWERLRLKLLTGVPAGVYLQMGTNLEALQSGLQHLELCMQQLASSGKGTSAGPDGAHSCKPAVYGSVFLPSKRLLAQMRFRPWNGVFLSHEYLSSVEQASAITQRLLQTYAAHGVAPLVESAVRSTAELRAVHDLLGSCRDKGVGDKAADVAQAPADASLNEGTS